MKDLKNLRCFELKFLGCTNNRGARVKITDINREESVVIPFDYADRDLCETAERFLNKKGIKIGYKSQTAKHYLLLSKWFLYSIKGGL